MNKERGRNIAAVIGIVAGILLGIGIAFTFAYQVYRQEVGNHDPQAGQMFVFSAGLFSFFGIIIGAKIGGAVGVLLFDRINRDRDSSPDKKPRESDSR
jgi:multisubunit Na+/H+ antiporter MnhB subunit